MRNPDYCPRCAELGAEVGVLKAKVLRLELELGRAVRRGELRRDVIASPLQHRVPFEGTW
jgi:hypothetical protein